MASIPFSFFRAFGSEHESEQQRRSHHGRRCSSDTGATSMIEYTQLHREAWPQLLHRPDTELLQPGNRECWLTIAGQLGAELYDCFERGDGHVRDDMIQRARCEGGWRGGLVANRLESWRNNIERSRDCA